jgi:hypothetical protein
MNVEKVSVQDPGYHRGSCGQAGRLNFHWKVACPGFDPRLVHF